MGGAPRFGYGMKTVAHRYSVIRSSSILELTTGQIQWNKKRVAKSHVGQIAIFVDPNGQSHVVEIGRPLVIGNMNIGREHDDIETD